MSEEDIERRMRELDLQATEFANAAALRFNLEHAKKSIIAIEMKAAEKLGITSAVKQEREAYASVTYKQWIDGTAEAVRNHERLRMEWEVTKLRFERWRTDQATRRAEMTYR